MIPAGRHAWIDASAGIAGDMLLGALADAGADLSVVQHAVDAVIPGATRIDGKPVHRAGLRALKVDVLVLVPDQPHRTWRDVRDLLVDSALADRIRQPALTVFTALAEAEAHVHGIPADEVHFHELGALDSIADVVGICAALEDLGAASLSASEIALGSGRVATSHGELPVPVPAVTELARGWRVNAGGRGELATPTGMAVIRALASVCEDLPAMLVEAVGAGAGSRDTPGRPNVVRVVVGAAVRTSPSNFAFEPAVLLEANVDDMDPRLWPSVLAGFLQAGAADAWLTPIVMKKGRPAHTLSVLCHPSRAERLRERIFCHTTTFGIREGSLGKVVLPRAFVNVGLTDGTVAIKIAHRDGVIVHVMPEFDEVASLARRQGRPERLVLQEAVAAAAGAGLTVGSPVPPHARTV